MRFLEEIRLSAGLEISEAFGDTTTHDTLDINADGKDTPSQEGWKRTTENYNPQKEATENFKKWMNNNKNLNYSLQDLKKNNESVTIESILENAANIYLVRKFGKESADIINGMPKSNIDAVKLLAKGEAKPKVLAYKERLKKWKERYGKWKDGGRKGKKPVRPVI